MPLDLVRVERVDALPTVKPNLQQFTVIAYTVEDVPRVTHYTTVNALRASLCQAAVKSRAALWLTWRENAWGKDILRVETDDTSWSQHV